MKSRFSDIFLSLKFKFYLMTLVFDENCLYTNVLYEFFLILMLCSKFAIFQAILVKNNKNIFFVQKWQFSFRPRSAIYWGVSLDAFWPIFFVLNRQFIQELIKGRPAGRPVALTFKRPIHIFIVTHCMCKKICQNWEISLFQSNSPSESVSRHESVTIKKWKKIHFNSTTWFVTVF